MEKFDIAIIGSGLVGMATAMYASRLGLRPVILGDMPGGTIITTDLVENYPGFKSISGFDLAEKLREHMEAYPVKSINDSVTGIERTGSCFVLKSSSESAQARTLVFATGSKHRHLSVPGAKEFENKGIHYCALCDGAFYRGKTVCVVGGSDSAIKEALVLARLAKNVYMFVRGDKLRGEPINIKRLGELENVKVVFRTEIKEIRGSSKVEEIELTAPLEGNSVIPMDALFVAIGMLPQSELAKGLEVMLNPRNEIMINRNSETNVPGVFAAGDVTDARFKQAITGVGEGVAAAYSAFKYCNENEDVECS